MNNKEQELMCAYMHKILLNKKSGRTILGLICTWLWDNAEEIGLDVDDVEVYDLLTEYPKALSDKNVGRDLYIRTRKHILTLLSLKGSKPFEHNGLENENLATLAESLKLDETDQEIFSIFFRYATNNPFESFIDEMSKKFFTANEILATLTGLDRQNITERISREGRLVQMGLLHPEGATSGYLQNCFSIPETVKRGLQSALLGKDDLHCHLLGKTSPKTLEWDDFEHLGEIRDQLESFISKVVQKQEHGINILIWGAPGTGKTEFCKTLADKIGIDLYSVCEEDHEGGEPSRNERLDALKLAQCLLREQNQAILLFDEMDDLLGVDSSSIFAPSRRLSKVFTNRIFETNPIPTIWTLNDINLLDEAILRRMSLAIEFKKPPRRSREKILNRMLKRRNIELSRSEMEPLLNVEVAPAILDSAVRFAEISGQSTKGLHFSLNGLTQALGAKMEFSKPIDNFEPDLVNAEINLKELTESLSGQSKRNFSLCLYGPPGTGKSEYARFLAEQMGMETHVVRTSDLIRPYVGESEMMIARAFRQARDMETFLIFDEADSLLSDRRNAKQSWQVSQVNEMLTWMESHPLPFVCTTNLKERLDQASMRRFTFKCCFNYLTTKQVITAFNHFFSLDLPESDAGRFSLLTPGDFAVVSKKADYLGVSKDTNRIVMMLHQEVEAKNEIKQKQLGFSIN